MSQNIFRGFSRETHKFFCDLEKNNNKPWFEENRDIFNEFVLNDAESFVVAMGSRLSAIAPDVVAIPKIDKTIFRIHRDVRFSKDKRPYKTHMALFFWEGPRKKMENSGFYIHMGTDNLFIGVGMYHFPKDILSAYRDAVVDKVHGPALVAAIEEVKQKGNYTLGWKEYKKVPRGYDPEHAYADLLLYSGMGFHYDSAITDELFSDKFLDFCYNKFEDMAPVHNWLRELVQRTG